MAKPESKIEALHLLHIEEAPYLRGGQRLKAAAKAAIVRDRRRSGKTIVRQEVEALDHDDLCHDPGRPLL
jgi:hypothetical protein